MDNDILKIAGNELKATIKNADRIGFAIVEEFGRELTHNEIFDLLFYCGQCIERNGANVEMTSTMPAEIILLARIHERKFKNKE